MATSQWQSLNLPQCPIVGVHSSVNLFLEHPENTSLALILCLSINSVRPFSSDSVWAATDLATSGTERGFFTTAALTGTFFP